MENEDKKVIPTMNGKMQHCEFDENRDIQRVESGLAVSITDALQTGVVHDATYMEDTNGISEPEQVLGRINDEFDAIEASRAIKKYGSCVVSVKDSNSKAIHNCQELVDKSVV